MGTEECGSIFQSKHTVEAGLYSYMKMILQDEFKPEFKPGYGYGEEWALFGKNIITKYSLGARITGNANVWWDQRHRIADLLHWTCKNIFGYNLVFSKVSTLSVFLQVFATKLDKLEFLSEDEKDDILYQVTLQFYERRKVAIDYLYTVHRGLPF